MLALALLGIALLLSYLLRSRFHRFLRPLKDASDKQQNLARIAVNLSSFRTYRCMATSPTVPIAVEEEAIGESHEIPSREP